MPLDMDVVRIARIASREVASVEPEVVSKCRQKAFTLVELLVVIGIISLLVALLLSAVMTARRQAYTVICASNAGNLAKAFMAYSYDWNGFPPVLTDGNYNWTHSDVMGRYVGYFYVGSVGYYSTGLVCPEDVGSVRSYSMNFWASSCVDPNHRPFAPTYGEFWGPSAKPISQLLLVLDAYSSSSHGAGWNHTPPHVGLRGNTPGQRFGALGGVQPFRLPSRIFATTQIEFRHGTANSPRVNLAFADGHVKSFTQEELVRPDGTLTGEAYWCPSDQ